MAKLLVVIDVPDNEADDFLEEVRSHLWWATVTEVDLSADDLDWAHEAMDECYIEGDEIGRRHKLTEAAAQLRGDA